MRTSRHSFRTMKKIWFLILFSLIIQGCNSHPTAENNENSTHMSIAPVQTWNNQIEETRPDDPNIPNCEPLDLKPIKPEEVIKIDDVVQNCKYEEGHIMYTPFGWGGAPTNIFLWGNGILSVDFEWGEKINPICEYRGQKQYPLENFDKELWLFIKKYQINENPYFNIIDAYGEVSSFNVATYFHCKEDHLCKKLIDTPFGSNSKHYFFHAYDDTWYYLIVDNARIYDVWEFIRNESDNVNTDIFIESPRFINSLKGHTLQISKYTNGSISEPYRSNPELADIKHEQTGVFPILWTFQVKSCEVQL